MDKDISRWIMEFLIRSSVPDSLIQKTLTALPLSPTDPSIKKNILLRTLQTFLRTATLPETALDTLELLEDINAHVSDSLRRLYCSVAVECTLKYLVGCPDDVYGEFAGAVQRIWYGRVPALKARRSGLVSSELMRWRDDIENAVGDSTVRERMARLNSRWDAMYEISVYLKETWGTMDPPSLETVAASERKKEKGECARRSDNDVDVDDVSDNDDDAYIELVAVPDQNQGKEPLDERVYASQEVAECDLIPQRDKAIQKEKRKSRHTAIRASKRGVKISDPEEVESAKSCRKQDSVPSTEVRKVRESLKSSSLELRALVKDPLTQALHISEIARSKLAANGTKIEPKIGNHSEAVEVQDPHVCQSIVLFQPNNDANLGKKSSVYRSSPRQSQFMERKRMADTFEWDDSIDTSPQTRQLRRKKRRWSVLEEETLRAGVDMFGEGNWAAIRSFYSNIFESRSGVDLKDKWRNMIRLH